MPRLHRAAIGNKQDTLCLAKLKQNLPTFNPEEHYTNQANLFRNWPPFKPAIAQKVRELCVLPIFTFLKLQGYNLLPGNLLGYSVRSSVIKSAIYPYAMGAVKALFQNKL